MEIALPVTEIGASASQVISSSMISLLFVVVKIKIIIVNRGVSQTIAFAKLKGQPHQENIYVAPLINFLSSQRRSAAVREELLQGLAPADLEFAASVSSFLFVCVLVCLFVCLFVASGFWSLPRL